MLFDTLNNVSPSRVKYCKCWMVLGLHGRKHLLLRLRPTHTHTHTLAILLTSPLPWLSRRSFTTVISPSYGDNQTDWEQTWNTAPHTRSHTHTLSAFGMNSRYGKPLAVNRYYSITSYSHPSTLPYQFNFVVGIDVPGWFPVVSQ